ncbi:MAG: hypothetical protein U0M20_03860 [Christensenellales bacterium]|nr:hypothetical protein [Christensenellales bacterium]
MPIDIRLGTEEDLDELEQLYGSLNDHLSNTTNYPGWIRGVYPIRGNCQKRRFGRLSICCA